MTFRFDIDDGNWHSSTEPGWTRLRLTQFRATMKGLSRFAAPAGYATTEWGEDLFLVARAIYLADRTAPRESVPDRWTRDIEVRIPVQQRDRWTPAALTALHELLPLLTGDRWSVTIKSTDRRYTINEAIPLSAADGTPLCSRPADEVALSSGGLDSASYAALSAQGNSATAYVGYAHPKLLNRVKDLAGRLELPSAFHPVDLGVFDPQDITFRSRGLLFVGTAVWVASAFRAARVTVPENGQLALNPPLTPARLASCSTRSVHPRTLFLLNRLLAELEIPIEVANPFADKTKGEVCRDALAAGADPQTLFRTISCGHPPIERGRAQLGHCGRCFPCLVRRSALLAAVGRDESDYERDYGEWNDDVLALRRWLGTRFTPTDLLADTPLPPTTELFDRYRTIIRGRQELAQLFQSLPHGHDLHLDAAA
jgi:hypothetical protein